MKLFAVLVIVATLPLYGGRLSVGPGKRYSRIEDALKKARKGDEIRVYPNKNDAPYQRVALYVDKPGVKIVAMKKGDKRITLSGKGFEYSGVGRTPRAIIQFNAGSDGSSISGFVLTDAHNKSHNGAGVRINSGNNIVVEDCEIHGNDMGVMSNGKLKSGQNQIIRHCHVHSNGSKAEPGYNHNFYLGGTSVTLAFCDVHSPITGHNVKSRAHFTRVMYCYIHDSGNREFDLVDSRETEAPESHALLMGNLIVKKRNMNGNKTVIHFGQDGGKQHNGKVFLYFNTIITPYISPVVDLSASKAGAVFVGNIIDDGGANQNGQALVKYRNGANAGNVSGSDNWLSAGFGKQKWPRTYTAPRKVHPPFKDVAKGDVGIKKRQRSLEYKGEKLSRLKIPTPPGADKAAAVEWQYKAPCDKEKRPGQSRPILGALGFK